MRSVRFEGESDDALRRRAERAAEIAHVLVTACLANQDVQAMIADPALPHSLDGFRQSPVVRVEYEQAMVIGGIGESLRVTRSKHWGDGPWIMPLERDDPVDPFRILYVYRENSVYNRRFEQRRRLKELLGRQHRTLVGKAMEAHGRKDRFLAELTAAERQAIEQCLHLTPGEFWQVARGKLLLNRLPADRQLTLQLDVADDCRDNRPLGPAATIDDFAEVVRLRSRKPPLTRQTMLDFAD